MARDPSKLDPFRQSSGFEAASYAWPEGVTAYKARPHVKAVYIPHERSSAQTVRHAIQESWPILISPVSILLNDAKHVSDPESLGKLVHQLTDLLTQQPHHTSALRSWLTNDADTWARDRRPALAAVIEVACHLALPETLQVIAAVLKGDDGDLTVASVAAQRARLLHSGDPTIVNEIGNLLARRIDAWLANPVTTQQALLALPSAFHFLRRTDLAWIEHRINDKNERVTWATCQGILDVAGSPNVALDTATSERLYRTVLSCLEPMLSPEWPPASAEGPDVAATLIWTLGALCPQTHLDEAASLFARVFAAPRGLRASATVRAGRLLVQHWSVEGMRALLDAFDASPDRARYLALVTVVR